MDWNCDKDTNMDYYYQTIKVGDNTLDAFIAWWLKIIELSKDKSDWNVIVADLWIDNTGRVIGHIQRDNQAVGYDRGFRVALTVEEWVDQLNVAFDMDDEQLYNNTINVLYSNAETMLRNAVAAPSVMTALKALYMQHPFSIHLAVRGYCDFDDGETMIDI